MAKAEINLREVHQMNMESTVAIRLTRNQDRSGSTRRKDVVREPVPRPFRVLATAVTVAVSSMVNGISILCATANSVISITGENSLEIEWI